MAKTVSIRSEYLIDLAKLKSGDDVFPITPGLPLESGIRKEKDELYLWYNDRTGSTHIVKESMKIQDVLKETK